MIQENIKAIRSEMEKHCMLSKRDPKDVTLIAVSKTKPLSMVNEAIAAGQFVFGENKVHNVFHASMIIRHANDGKKYLYDIIDIKKETSTLLEP